MTLSCPPKVSAASGMDTLTHAIESYVSVKATTETRLCARGRATVRQTPENRCAQRSELGGARRDVAREPLRRHFDIKRGHGSRSRNGVPVGAQFHTPHGVSNALLLPNVMDFNYLGDLDLFTDIAEAMAEPLAGLSSRQKAEAAVKAVRQISVDTKIPQTLSEVGVTEASLATMADDAIEIRRLLDNNPRSVTRGDIYEIYRAAF